MISKTNQYAVRAVLYLAQESGGNPVRASEIAASLGLPANYLSKILHVLARAGVLESERGPRGGFRLAKPAEELSLEEVMAPFDSVGERRFCLLGEDECSDDAPCRIHHDWKSAMDPMIEFFKQTTVAELAGKVKRHEGENPTR